MAPRPKNLIAVESIEDQRGVYVLIGIEDDGVLWKTTLQLSRPEGWHIEKPWQKLTDPNEST